MARVIGEILIERPVEEVFDYVADQRNEPIYNPQMLHSEKITDGPIGVGTRFRAMARSGRRPVEMLMEVTEFKRPTKLGSRTTMSTVDVDGGLTFEPLAEATRMRWSWEVSPRGPLRLFGPLVARLGRRQERTIWSGLKAQLEESDPRDSHTRALPADLPGSPPDELSVQADAMMSRHHVQHPLAVITGASSGIGRELARLAAQDGYDLMVVARRADRLAALVAEVTAFGATTEPVVVDLAQPTGGQQVVEAIAGRPVEVLINDAGFGGCGRFATERHLATDLAMIQLNITTLVELTGLLLPGMLERRRGGILNVSSIAGYLPGPGQAVYNASKAFVKSFSQALSEETRNTGVRVTALCPGPVATEFASVAGIRQPTSRNPLMRVLSAAEVAAAGWQGLATGRPLVVPDLMTRIGLQSLRFLPWQVIARASQSSNR
jgi:short-subunit dehydrogenase